MKFRYALLLACFLVPSTLRAQVANCSKIQDQYTGGSQGSLSGCNSIKTWAYPFVFNRTWNFNWQCQTIAPLAQATYQQGSVSITTSGECYYGVTSQFVCPPTYTITNSSSRTAPSNNTLTWQTYEGKWASMSVCRNTAASGAEKGMVAVATCAAVGCSPNPNPCPIVIDLNDEGFPLTDPEVWFKWGDQLLKTGWTAKGSHVGFLVLPGPDGSIDNASEMFGDFTPQPPTDFPNGFNALSVYDDPKNGGNGDHQITAKDSVFHSLRVWVGRPDANGKARPEDLYTLESLGITSISIDSQPDTYVDRYGNQFRLRGHVSGLADHTIYDVTFVTDCPLKK